MCGRALQRAVGLVPDYVSRLARLVQIKGRRVSGIWFVDQNALNVFIAEQERQKEI
jgi:hypothetical protein